jgi:hypothetical protein
MSSFAKDEIVATVEAFGDELQGDARAMEAVLRAIADRLAPLKEGGDTPKYHLYEASEYGRMIAESEVSGCLAWAWLRDELLRLADKLQKTPEFYI